MELGKTLGQELNSTEEIDGNLDRKWSFRCGLSPKHH